MCSGWVEFAQAKLHPRVRWLAGRSNETTLSARTYLLHRPNGIGPNLQSNSSERTMKRSTGVLGLLLFVMVGCADDKELQTKFGSAKSVREYRKLVKDVIVEANAIEREARDRAVGSTGQASGENLSPVYRQLRPRLVVLIAKMESIESPKKLADMHADVLAALGLRLAAYDLVIEGWQIEHQQTFEDAQPLYIDAAKKLNEGTGILLQVNEVLLEVDIALAEAEGRTLVS